ncbi:MAG: amino acid permease [Bacteroidia bacterium]|nr:amino acid permease [Bacteroidia bacterium]
MDSNKSIFLRPVSGLVKSAGIFDVFIYNVGLISIGIGVAYTHLYGAANYPGGDIPIASLIATGIMVLVGLGMWCWTVTLPRSGGIYVFVTRGLSAPLGFALSFVESCCWLFYNAVGAVLISTVGLTPLFATIASITKSNSMMQLALNMQTPNAQFIVGSILIILSGLLLISGMRKFFIVQKIMFFVAIIGTLVMIVALMVFPKEQFVANFNELMNHIGNNAYNTVIDKAKIAGWDSNRFDIWQTLRLSVWPFLPLIGGAFSIAIGGEIRQVEKGQGYGIIGAIIFCGALFALIGYLSYQTIGYEFQGAITYNSFNQPEFSTSTQPYFTLLMAILTKNIYFTVIIAISFIAWIYFWIPGMLAYAERAMLAWSFDRLVPEKIGHVSDKYHTPTVAIIISVLISVFFTALYVYTSFFATLIFILAASIAWFITMIAGIIFPYRNKDIYEKSPISKYKILKIPLMSVVCSLAAIGLLVIAVLLWNDPIAAGHDTKSIITIGGVFLIGLLLYFFMKQKRKKQGIDIDLAFKQIPIE